MGSSGTQARSFGSKRHRLTVDVYLGFMLEPSITVAAGRGNALTVSYVCQRDDFRRVSAIVYQGIKRFGGVAGGSCGGLNGGCVTADFSRGVSAEELEGALQELLPLSMVELQRAAGCDPIEDGYEAFSEATSHADLVAWALAHYKADGINDMSSLAVIRNSKAAKYHQALPLDAIRLTAAGQRDMNSEKIAIYAELMQSGVAFPPLILGRTRVLCEGYHRFMAAEKIGRATIAAIQLC